jgi:pimeloyl-ACP methyl ester carboxylesterase
VTDLRPLDVRVSGAGEPLLLVHGGVNRDQTWSPQATLAERWRLVVPARRGYPPSPPTERQDYEADARDIAALLAVEPAHCAGFSYGGVGLAVAAAADPSRLLSLTLIEPPLFAVAADRPEVREFMALAAAYTGDDPVAREQARKEFEAVARIRFPGDPEQERAFVEARRLAPGLRPPGEAQPDLAAIAAAGVPSLVVSGDHHPAIEAVCDALSDQLRAERVKLRGRGHAVQHVPGFNGALERFLRDARKGASRS